MLKKLLKYDFKYIFKLWWIGAVVSVALSLLGGGCIRLLDSERELPVVVTTVAILLMVLVVFSFIAFSLLATILVFIRFYKNFFSDEGYLTFTLPAKTSTLLHSKLITSVAAVSITSIMLVMNVLLMITVGTDVNVFSEILDLIEDGFRYLGAYFAVYIIEVLLILLLMSVFSVLLTFVCITFASVITKKGRVFAAIGIYYGANSVIGFISQLCMLFGLSGVLEWISALPSDSINAVSALTLLVIVLFMALLCGLMYVLQRWMLDRKLNLA